ncbi:hypothetical protein [Parvularcula dongshanensis]|uniref:Uncharacterized protein n=1 Tax=Parvularcula dongshanensis TaxID=1173995 RepID=A0A840I3I6_9PROT|nr:hypothetical protein [Parvularcula dongshanensis]MBB4658841.1 hypothetical protein [Parvularcula dongshanensis]
MGLSGFALRLRLILRRAAFGTAVGLLFGGALALLIAAGVVAVAARYGLVAGLLSGAGFLVFLGILVAIVGRPRRGLATPAAAVASGPVPQAPPASLAGGLSAASGLLPNGAKEVVAGVVARQLTIRPGRTIGAALAVGAAITLVGAMRRRSPPPR